MLKYFYFYLSTQTQYFIQHCLQHMHMHYKFAHVENLKLYSFVTYSEYNFGKVESCFKLYNL
jgi:hypothetical protein